MRNIKIPLFSALVILLSNTSFAADPIDVENCTKEKKAKYANIYQQCFPITATCWGWGAGENAVYEYCNFDEIKKRVKRMGAATDPSEMGTKKDWDCGGSKSSC